MLVLQAIGGYLLEGSGAFDYFGSQTELKAFVEARNPKRIGLNISKNYGGADGLTHSSYLELSEILGKKYEKILLRQSLTLSAIAVTANTTSQYAYLHHNTCA